MKFSQAIASAPHLPVWVDDVPPSVWAQTWADRPRETVRLGGRSLSEQDLSEVSALAQAHAERTYPHESDDSDLRVNDYNRMLVCYGVGRMLCSPDSADVPFWDAADLVAPMALEPSGALGLYSAICAACVAQSVLVPTESLHDAFARLSLVLAPSASISETRRHQVTRLLLAAIEIVDEC